MIFRSLSDRHLLFPPLSGVMWVEATFHIWFQPLSGVIVLYTVAPKSSLFRPPLDESESAPAETMSKNYPYPSGIFDTSFRESKYYSRFLQKSLLIFW
jgi:hypothetical protein